MIAFLLRVQSISIFARPFTVTTTHKVFTPQKDWNCVYSTRKFRRRNFLRQIPWPMLFAQTNVGILRTFQIESDRFANWFSWKLNFGIIVLCSQLNDWPISLMVLDIGSWFRTYIFSRLYFCLASDDDTKNVQTPKHIFLQTTAANKCKF